MSRITLRVVQPVDEAAPHTAMRCSRVCSGAHNLSIAARLASRAALPGSTMLAASTGCSGRSARKLASLRQPARFIPSALSMLGAGQREKRQRIKNNFESTSMGCLRPLAPPKEPHLLSKTPIDGFVKCPRSRRAKLEARGVQEVRRSNEGCSTTQTLGILRSRQDGR